MRAPHEARRNGLINARERGAILCFMVEAYRQKARQWRSECGRRDQEAIDLFDACLPFDAHDI